MRLCHHQRDLSHDLIVWLPSLKTFEATLCRRFPQIQCSQPSGWNRALPFHLVGWDCQTLFHFPEGQPFLPLGLICRCPTPHAFSSLSHLVTASSFFEIQVRCHFSTPPLTLLCSPHISGPLLHPRSSHCIVMGACTGLWTSQSRAVALCPF